MRLQVLLDGEWKYVFCRNELHSTPITTEDPKKAIRGSQESLDYFKGYFGNLDFRIKKGE